MKQTLVLLRHAKSSWANPDLSDFDRPLKKRGKYDAPLMGEVLRGKLPEPDLVLSSSSARTRETVKLFFTAFMPEKKVPVRWKEELYMAEATEMVELIRQQDKRVKSLWLVGHNPGLTELVNWLAPHFELDNLPTTGVFALTYPTKSWAEVGVEQGTVLCFEKPRFYK